jgi:hypothetical protein
MAFLPGIEKVVFHGRLTTVHDRCQSRGRVGALVRCRSWNECAEQIEHHRANKRVRYC